MLSRLVVVTCLALVGCGEGLTFDDEPGPGPDDGIATRLATEEELLAATAWMPIVQCDGPDEEITAIGGLCAGVISGAVSTDRAGDLSFVFIEEPTADSEYAIVVFGYFDGSVDVDRASDIRYAAYMVRGTDASFESDRWYADLFGSYANGERLTGEIATLRATPSACSSSVFMGIATLVWRNTTISFPFNAESPCR